MAVSVLSRRFILLVMLIIVSKCSYGETVPETSSVFGSYICSSMRRVLYCSVLVIARCNALWSLKGGK